MDLTYDLFNRTEPSMIYIARPGQRIIGALSGIREDTARCEINLNNTDVLEFDVDRDINGEINPHYEYIAQHYELYVTHVGWFKINEEPTLTNDGNVEYKSVRAESLEIELQQYDLVNFYVGTGEVNSKEMLATDNTYMIDDFQMFRDQVKFWRDTSDHEALSAAFAEAEGSTVADLEEYLYEYPGILTSWRIDFDYETFDNAINATVTEYQQEGKSTTVLESWLGKVKTKDVAMTLVTTYPELLKYTHITVDQDNPDSETDYTIQEVIDLEVARQHELSFLWLVLHEHGWNVGYVDTYVDPNSELIADHERLKDRIGRFEIESQDIYSFLTQEAAQYYRCIFVFDTDNYLVNAYKIENVGKDTNISVSFHSIQNSVSRTADEQLKTVFHVQGNEELDFTEANFGEDWIEDLSYFLDSEQPHFSDTLKAKYIYWRDYREEQRPAYIQLSKDYRNKLDESTEIYDRVPLDGVDTGQYSTFSEDELLAERANYQAFMRGLETRYVDENNEFDIDLMRETGPYDYANYILIRDQIIPNIDIELENRDALTVDDQRDFLDGYKYDFDTYGMSYGVAELNTQMTVLTNSIAVLKRNGYDEEGEQGDEYWAAQHALYLKYVAAQASCQRALTARTQEYEDAVDDLNDIAQQMAEMKEDVAKTNPQFGFTTKDLWLLDKYYIHTDYVNENILVTSISTNEEIVDTEYQLYLDAVDRLYVESHPQYVFETTQDNLLIIPEFTGWHEDLSVGNFIRVSLREGTGKTAEPINFPDTALVQDSSPVRRLGEEQIKLRITMIGFNPYLIEDSIDLTFSNMIQYKAKRNDFASILESANGSSKGQISSRLGTTFGKTTADDINISPALILKLINNDTFGSYMNSFASDTQAAVIGGVTASTISAVSGQIATLVSQQIDAAEINVGRIVGTTAEFQEVFADYIGADYVAAEMARLGTADIENLTAKIITVGTNSITTIAEGTISTEKVVAALVSGETGDFNTLTSNTAFIDYLNSGIINAGTVTADAVITALLQATQAEVQELTAQNAFIDFLESNLVVASEIQVNDLKAKLAQVDTLTAGSAFVTYLQGLSSSVAQSTIDDAYIYDAVAGKITVGDLAAGDITVSDTMRIISENGNMVMNGSALQILGEDSQGNPYVGVQLGYATNGQPSLILRNEEGATILTPTGITSDAIADQLIVNDMIHNGTISKGKLGFEVIEPNAQGGIDITQVYDGSGNLWGVQYTSFKNGTEQALNEINSQKMYRVVIESNNGNIFKNSDINCTLSCRVYSWDDEITDDVNAANFVWTRKSNDTSGDTIWNMNHSGGAKSITLTPSDVHGRSVFYCTVTLPDGSAVTGS